MKCVLEDVSILFFWVKKIKKALEKSRASAEESVKFQLRSGTRPEKMSFEADAVVI